MEVTSWGKTIFSKWFDFAKFTKPDLLAETLSISACSNSRQSSKISTAKFDSTKPFGGEYDVTEPFFYKEEIPNLFGGEPIPGDGKIIFEDIDFESSFCVLKQEIDMDPVKALETMKAALIKMGFDEETLKKTLTDSKFDIKDRNTYEYYYYPGVPHKIVTKREIIFNVGEDKRRKVEKYLVELIYDDEE